jgi:hypothetical protein
MAKFGFNLGQGLQAIACLHAHAAALVVTVNVCDAVAAHKQGSTVFWA